MEILCKLIPEFRSLIQAQPRSAGADHSQATPKTNLRDPDEFDSWALGLLPDSLYRSVSTTAAPGSGKRLQSVLCAVPNADKLTLSAGPEGCKSR